MNPVLFWALLLFCGAAFAVESEAHAKAAFESGRFNEAVKAYQALLQKASAEKRPKLLKGLAESYYKDQDHEKAYSTFLEALSALPAPKAPETPSKEDQALYEEALKIYLDPTERDPQMTALKLHDQYAGILRLHPNYYLLGYVVAVSYANMNEMDKFFDIFYNSYQHMPNQYLAYKSIAILHWKLFERGKGVEEKEKQRAAVLSALESAKQLYPQDASLYRLQISFAAPKDREDVLKRNLKEMVDRSIVIPRADLSIYFDQLFAYGEVELARELLVKARGWYPYSRTLDAAKEILEEKK